jgi:phosphotransferase family enzyme
MEKETALSGGNVTGVIRIGETVHRAMGPWSSAVHGLLHSLEVQGFEGAPRFLGLDRQGREILTFIEGEVGHYPLQQYMWSDENLMEVAHLLRRYHDATVGYSAPDGASWQFEYPDRHQHEIICHNDVAPYNMVYRDGKPQALIDFDTAGPGPRIWDIAYAVYRFVPLSYAQDMQALGLADPTIQGQRLRLFCQAYGLMYSYEEVLDTVVRRLEALCALLIERAHDPIYQKMRDEGHLDHYRREIASLRHYMHIH